MFRVLLSVGVLALGCNSLAYELFGKVERVIDGDSIVLLDHANKKNRIRLLGIDAPEKQQRHGGEATQYLKGAIQQKNVRLECLEKDRYKRHLCIVFINDEDVNLELVRRGLAWHYVRYAANQEESARERYAQAEKSACDAQLGLWSGVKPEAPWDFRRNVRERSQRRHSK